MRTIWSVVVGGAAGIVAMMLVEFLVSLVVPAPANLDITRPGASATYIESLPVLLLALQIVSWAIGSYVAAFVAMRMAKGTSILPGVVAGAVPLLAGVIDMALIPHPIWMWVLGVTALTVPAYYAARMMLPKQASLRDAIG
ncbi:MAG: hypothetical protein JO348_06710 [Alphaproteobacteria bacterium]|nr:hypothetical protein [Alphaproteobacteria bacterium]MBV9419447.1 hypothetical protein [Alphaproteobacteria bacterium]